MHEGFCASFRKYLVCVARKEHNVVSSKRLRLWKMCLLFAFEMRVHVCEHPSPHKVKEDSGWSTPWTSSFCVGGNNNRIKGLLGIIMLPEAWLNVSAKSMVHRLLGSEPDQTLEPRTVWTVGKSHSPADGEFCVCTDIVFKREERRSPFSSFHHLVCYDFRFPVIKRIRVKFSKRRGIPSLGWP